MPWHKVTVATSEGLLYNSSFWSTNSTELNGVLWVLIFHRPALPHLTVFITPLISVLHLKFHFLVWNGYYSNSLQHQWTWQMSFQEYNIWKNILNSIWIQFEFNTCQMEIKRKQRDISSARSTNNRMSLYAVALQLPWPAQLCPVNKASSKKSLWFVKDVV